MYKGYLQINERKTLAIQCENRQKMQKVDRKENADRAGQPHL